MSLRWIHNLLVLRSKIMNCISLRVFAVRPTSYSKNFTRTGVRILPNMAARARQISLGTSHKVKVDIL